MNATMTARRGLRVAALAAAVGVNVETIRHHEWNGLLLAPARTPAGLPGLRAHPRLPDCGSSEGATAGSEASRHQRPASDPR